jgi:hypothetical protein
MRWQDYRHVAAALIISNEERPAGASTVFAFGPLVGGEGVVFLVFAPARNTSPSLPKPQPRRPGLSRVEGKRWLPHPVQTNWIGYLTALGFNTPASCPIR